MTLDDEKRFYQRFWALHRDRDLVQVFKRFGVDAFRRSSVLEGFEDFVKATGFRGRRCVEIGTCKGLTAVILARYFEEVVSIDIMPNPTKHEIVAHLGIENIRFLDVVDNAQKALEIETMTFDGAYVDGDHAHDADADFALVRRCGAVLFHEYWEEQVPVWRLVNQLRGVGAVETSGKFALWRAA